MGDESSDEQGLSSVLEIRETVSPLQSLRNQAIAPPLLRHPFRWLRWLVESVVAVGGGILFLAVLAALPGANVLALGVFLEAEGEVARTGKLRNGFPLRHLIPRLMTIGLGIFAVCLPLWILSGFARDAEIIAPYSLMPSVGRTGWGLLGC